MAAFVVATGARPSTLCAAPGDASGAPTAETYGFDHVVHDGRVSVSGKDPLDCTLCHRLSGTGFLIGAPDHRSCFGPCHDAPAARGGTRQPYPQAMENLPMCGSCHSRVSLESAALGDGRAAGTRLVPHYPPYRIERDFGLSLDHKAHTVASTGCEGCHRQSASKGPRRSSDRPHARCVACHTKPRGNAPPMTKCTSCHPIAYGPAAAPHLEHGQVRVTGAFSHERHRTVSTAGGCLSCHAGIARATGDALPAPTTGDCGTCHDGSTAFSTVSTACTKCHATPSRDPLPMATRSVIFRHQTHRPAAGSGQGRAAVDSDTNASTTDSAAPIQFAAAPSTTLLCATCHALDASGTPTPAGRGHFPCASSGCHAEQFALPGQALCAVCHVGAEPWRPLHLDRENSAVREFVVAFSHATHSANSELPCVACHVYRHSESPAVADMTLANGHASCAGSRCHPTGGAEAAIPSFAECGRCHQDRKPATEGRERRLKKWSVKTKFRHEGHLVRNGAQLSCDFCHRGINESPTTAEIRPPRKASCLPCHEGHTAFKVTGHGCVRCHSMVTERP